MSETYTASEDHRDQLDPQLYEIRVKGHLDARWAIRFGDMTLTLEENGNTLLRGYVVDQAALHGLLRQVRDLGMPLLSVISVEDSQSHARGARK